jgi:hypothetical protein
VRAVATGPPAQQRSRRRCRGRVVSAVATPPCPAAEVMQGLVVRAVATGTPAQQQSRRRCRGRVVSAVATPPCPAAEETMMQGTGGECGSHRPPAQQRMGRDRLGRFMGMCQRLAGVGSPTHTLGRNQSAATLHGYGPAPRLAGVGSPTHTLGRNQLGRFMGLGQRLASVGSPIYPFIGMQTIGWDATWVWASASPV